MILSNGRFLAAQEIFHLVASRGSVSREVARGLGELTQPSLNDSVFEDAVAYLASSRMIRESDEGLTLSKLGKRLSRNGEASRLEIARGILHELIIREFPELIALAFRNPLDRIREQDLDARSCLDECQLLGYELSEEAEEWWKKLRNLGVYSEDSSKAIIGRNSEQRSVDFEVMRLNAGGCDAPSKEVHLVAEENDMAGFDVLSLNFGWEPTRQDREPLRIEVKTGRIESNNSQFSLVISSRELEIAQLGSGLWALHVWFTGDSKWAARESPITLRLDEVLAAAPTDTPSSAWQTSRLFFEFVD